MGLDRGMLPWFNRGMRRLWIGYFVLLVVVVMAFAGVPELVKWMDAAYAAVVGGGMAEDVKGWLLAFGWLSVVMGGVAAAWLLPVLLTD